MRLTHISKELFSLSTLHFRVILDYQNLTNMALEKIFWRDEIYSYFSLWLQGENWKPTASQRGSGLPEIISQSTSLEKLCLRQRCYQWMTGRTTSCPELFGYANLSPSNPNVINMHLHLFSFPMLPHWINLSLLFSVTWLFSWPDEEQVFKPTC